jgi:hypothetical protein
MSAVSDDIFDDWLAGVEADGSTFSKEYVAYSTLRDAFDLAKSILGSNR